MVDVSVIVPVYNVEKYLAECLDSIVEQKFENMQVICIDDCSTDASLNILKNYAKRYSCIEIIQNERNMGLAQTRNIGLEKAKGTYILFVDADDYLMPDIMDNLYGECCIRNLDILEFDAESFCDPEFKTEFNIQSRVHKYQYNDSIGVALLCRLIEKKEMSGCVWIRIYRREFLLNRQIYFIRGILHEDIPFTFRALMMAERVGYYRKTAYCYRQRQKSIMHNSEYGRHWEGLWIGYMDMLRVWHDFIFVNGYNERYSVSIMNYLDLIMMMTRHYYNEYYLDMHRTTDEFARYIDEKNFIYSNDKLDNYFKKEDIILLLNAGSVSIFGAGKISQKIITLLMTRKIIIETIYVTDKEKNKTHIAGIEVEQIDNCVMNNKADILVVAVSVNIQNEVEEIIKKYYKGKIIKTILE